ncbi:DUF3037 domain-containing protein [Pseudoduganella ginsengisoli]|uniref:DUF3037 domain-containing protein n=1 Tax=Pseudoduganella ginsengisoli TaxID=1462440 RepID=A0A6L6PTY1_9BURK|nr:DUF3037 domain-containing protein [Pseudoduganella ginsengisoli]MTW00960.1 DUF3037 domain-containing protein [Pseudoduganella ginsengisoli]
MTKVGCLYAIVRFCPFVETEEFANVGIVMLAPQQRRLTFKLMTKKHARVTGFFEQLDGTVFRAVISGLREELVRTADMINGADTDVETAKALFHEIVRARETVVKFSAVRAILADDPKSTLDDLYGHYVERDFVTKEYRETVLERVMRRWLKTAGFGERFERMEVGNAEYHAVFPFVEACGPIQVTAIKPLNLAQDQPSKILDHGGNWLFRVQTLRRKDLLPQKVLFPVEGPSDDGPRGKAFREIVGELSEVGATVLDYNDKLALAESLVIAH